MRSAEQVLLGTDAPPRLLAVPLVVFVGCDTEEMAATRAVLVPGVCAGHDLGTVTAVELLCRSSFYNGKYDTGNNLWPIDSVLFVTQFARRY